MSNREKILGLLVGVLLAAFAVFGVFRSVQNGMRSRQAKIANMNNKIRQEENKKMLGLEDAHLVREFKLRSLDASADKAHLDFSHWLETQVEEVGLSPKMVRYNDIRKSTDDYRELTYTVTGEGNIKQVRDLLYRIQSADTLHRVERFSLRQANEESKKLKLELNIAALSMGDIEGAKKTPVGTMVETKLGKTLEDYDVIVTRNIFAPANNPPKFKSLRTQTVELGKQFDFQLSATDVDGHQLSYRLLESPDGAKLAKRNLKWKPSELGDYEFEVEVEDDGVPSKRDVATVRVRVIPERKASPKREEFDDATVTELTGVVKGPRDDGLRIWLKVQSKDELLFLGEGDEINVGKWQGTVKSIQRKMALLESADGDVFELGLGGILANATPLQGESR